MIRPLRAVRGTVKIGINKIRGTRSTASTVDEANIARSVAPRRNSRRGESRRDLLGELRGSISAASLEQAADDSDDNRAERKRRAARCNVQSRDSLLRKNRRG